MEEGLEERLEEGEKERVEAVGEGEEEDLFEALGQVDDGVDAPSQLPSARHILSIIGKAKRDRPRDLR